MEEELEIFRAFDSIQSARFALLDMLEEHDIPHNIYRDAYRQDVILGSSMDMIDVWVRIRREDFKRVNDLMLAAAQERNKEIPEEHYLLEMNNQELLDILKNRDDWGIDDFVIARMVLADRGIPVTDEAIEQWAARRLQRMEAEKKSELNNESMIGTSLLVRAAHIQDASVVNMQTGERKYIYTEDERKKSRITYVIGLIVFLIVMLIAMAQTGRVNIPILIQLQL